MKEAADFEFRHEGFCDICEERVTFRAAHPWFRDHLRCPGCESIPRERALMHVIKTFFPDYQSRRIHESSPIGRGASRRLARDCKEYSASHYFPQVKPGEIEEHSGLRCENLETLTFPDGRIDLFVTQDVLEHVFDPRSAFGEIARVVSPGGAHIFTTPLVNKAKASEQWATMSDDGEVIFHGTPEYHGNPIDSKGSPVTMHWGYDITDFIAKSSGMLSTIVFIDNIDLGIRAEYIEVIVSRKAG